MGSVKKDLFTHEKALETTYPLDTPEGVEALLKNFHKVAISRYELGDFDACNMLLDFFTALGKCKFTPRQIQSLTFVYFLDYSQREAAEIMGCSPQSTQQHVRAAIAKIAAQYARDLEGLGEIETDEGSGEDSEI
mgnify:CR=1 FL=1